MIGGPTLMNRCYFARTLGYRPLTLPNASCGYLQLYLQATGQESVLQHWVIQFRLYYP